MLDCNIIYFFIAPRFNQTPDWGVILKDTNMYRFGSEIPYFSVQKTDCRLASQTIISVLILIKGDNKFYFECLASR